MGLKTPGNDLMKKKFSIQTEEEDRPLNVNHEFFDVIESIVDYTKPVTFDRPPRIEPLSKALFSPTAAQNQDGESSEQKTNVLKSFKSSFGPNSLSKKTVEKAIKGVVPIGSVQNKNTI